MPLLYPAPCYKEMEFFLSAIFNKGVKMQQYFRSHFIILLFQH